MKKRIVCTIIVMALALPVKAAIFKGIIRLNIRSGEPLAGVVISADGAEQKVSRSDGRFTLNFLEKNVGQKVKLIFTMPGYVVVMPEMDEEHFLQDNPVEEVEIVLCKKEEREKYRSIYIRQRPMEEVERKYQALIDSLVRSNRDYGDTVAALRSKMEAEKVLIDKNVDRFKDLGDEASDSSKYAFRMFLKGEIDEALRILSSVREPIWPYILGGSAVVLGTTIYLLTRHTDGQTVDTGFPLPPGRK